jgi:hypothetical protein
LLPASEQLLFLVAEANNRQAVMLHDGVRKLGNVAPHEAQAVRKLLDDAAVEHGQDQVIVMKLISLDDVTAWTSLTMTGIGMVNERVARKHARNSHKLKEKHGKCTMG